VLRSGTAAKKNLHHCRVTLRSGQHQGRVS
jgi:hypothetical protein